MADYEPLSKGQAVKLRFQVDQAECLRNGIDCPKSIVLLEVNPAELTQPQRDLLADRLDGIDVCELGFKDGQIMKVYDYWETEDEKPKNGKPARPLKLKTASPDFKGLMEAVLKNELWIRERGRSWIAQNPMDNFAHRKHAGAKNGTLAMVALSETDYADPDDKEVEMILRER